MSEAATPVRVSVPPMGAPMAAPVAGTMSTSLGYAPPRSPSPPPAPGAGRNASLRTRAIRGTVWTAAGYGTSLVLRLGVNLVLTRLLAPPMFGLMSLVNIFIQGLQGFSDVGIGPGIVQSKRGDDPIFLNTAWTVQALRGFALGGVSALIAWPVAKLYGEATLMWLLPMAGSAAVIAGFNSTSVFTLNRHLEVARLTVLNLAGQVTGAAVMIGWALFWPSVWALVAGNVASAVVILACTHLMLPGIRNRFHWDKAAASEMMRFGRWIFVSTLLTFLALQADRLVFGKLITLHELGVYSVAAMMASLPTSVLMRLGGTVVFPAYSRARAAGNAAPAAAQGAAQAKTAAAPADRMEIEPVSPAPSGLAAPDIAGSELGTTEAAALEATPVAPAGQRSDRPEVAGREFRRVFDRVRLPLVAFGGLVSATMIAGGPHLIHMLYDPRYHGAGLMLQLLAAAGWFQVLQISNGSALLALGSPKSVAASNVAKLATLLVGIPLGFRLYGLNGAIVGLIAADVLKYIVTGAAARARGLRGGRTDVLLTLLVAATSAAAIGAAASVEGPLLSWLGRGGGAVSSTRVMKLAKLGELTVIAATTGVVWVPLLLRWMRSRKAVG